MSSIGTRPSEITNRRPAKGAPASRTDRTSAVSSRHAPHGTLRAARIRVGGKCHPIDDTLPGRRPALNLLYGYHTLPCCAAPKLGGVIGVLFPVSVSRIHSTLAVRLRAV